MKRVWKWFTNGWNGLVSSAVIGGMVVWMIVDEHGQSWRSTTTSAVWEFLKSKGALAWQPIDSMWNAAISVQHPVIWSFFLMAVGCAVGVALPWRIPWRKRVQMSGETPKIPAPRMYVDTAGQLQIPPTEALTEDDLKMLQAIAKRDGRSVTIMQLRTSLYRGHIITEQHVKRLEQMGYLRWVASFYDSAISLTDKGVQLAMKSGWVR